MLLILQALYSLITFPQHLENERSFQSREHILKKKIHLFFFPLKQIKADSNISHRQLLVIILGRNNIFQQKYCILPLHHCFDIRLFIFVNIYPCFRSIYPLFYHGPFLQISQFTLPLLLGHQLGLFGTCKLYIQTFSGLRFCLQMHFPPQQHCLRCGM